MSLSPIRPPAAPTQDAPHKLSSPQTPTPHHVGLHRKSNPALLSATGSSGFEPHTRASGPKITLPVAPGAPEPVKAGKPGTVSGTGTTTGTSAVGSVGSGAIDALFNKGSATFEKILGGFGISSPPIEDPTARLQARSDQLGQVLTADPSLKNQVSKGDLMQAWQISQIFSSPDFYGSLNETQQSAVNSFNNSFAMLCGADWPPPPGGGYAKG
jgi:hypothetical protein